MEKNIQPWGNTSLKQNLFLYLNLQSDHPKNFTMCLSWMALQWESGMLATGQLLYCTVVHRNEYALVRKTLDVRKYCSNYSNCTSAL